MRRTQVVVSQAAAGAILLAAGAEHAPDAVGAVALVVADLILLAVVVVFARRGAERLTPATLGVRRTRFWPAVGWMLAIYFGQPRNRATAALVLGIIALLASLLSPLIGWVIAAFAVTFGAKGRVRARRAGRDDGRATAGIVLGIVAILVGVAQIALAIAFL